MNGAELKSWRKKIGYTQEEAAREFGVSRPTVQNWEYENTSVPLVVELASHRLLRQWKQRREYGPVFLIYFDLQNALRKRSAASGVQTTLLLFEKSQNVRLELKPGVF